MNDEMIILRQNRRNVYEPNEKCIWESCNEKCECSECINCLHYRPDYKAEIVGGNKDE